MATGVGFEGSNGIMYGSGDVRDLQVFITDDPPQRISCWRLTEEELAEVARTGVVWVNVHANGMPPIYVSGTALILVDDRPSKAEPVLPHKPHNDRNVENT